MLRIKESVDLKKLEKFGFEENEFYPNYVYETRAKDGHYVFVHVEIETREVGGFLANYYHTPLNEKQIKYFCPSIFEANLVEKVGGESE